VPIAVLGAVVALPVALVVAVIGLPFVLLAACAAVVLAVVFGLFGAFVGLAAMAIKLALFVVLPVAVVVWLLKRVFGGRREAVQSW
jgi:hypothetical protein